MAKNLPSENGNGTSFSDAEACTVEMLWVSLELCSVNVESWLSLRTIKKAIEVGKRKMNKDVINLFQPH